MSYFLNTLFSVRNKRTENLPFFLSYSLLMMFKIGSQTTFFITKILLSVSIPLLCQGTFTMPELDSPYFASKSVKRRFFFLCF